MTNKKLRPVWSFLFVTGVSLGESNEVGSGGDTPPVEEGMGKPS